MNLHRSFRFAPLRWSAIVTSIALPAAITWLLITQAGPVLRFHEDLRRTLLSWSGVPVSGMADAGGFPGAVVLSPITAVAGYTGRAWLPWLVCGIAALAMGAVYLRVRLSRAIICFGAVLLLLSAALSGNAEDSKRFVGLWLRCEFLIWMFLPWIMSLLAGFIVPSFWVRGFWTLAASAYGIVWSAVRLTFCSGLLFLAGSVLVLPLWFCLGILADLLFLCCFYSFAVYQAGSMDEAAAR